jgi:hypothetical protein
VPRIEIAAKRAQTGGPIVAAAAANPSAVAPGFATQSGRSMEGGIAAMPANLLEHADHALTQFTRCAVTADARRQFEHFVRHHTTPQ